MHNKAAEKCHISSKMLNDSEKRKVKDLCSHICFYQRTAYNTLHIHNSDRPTFYFQDKC